MLPPAQAEAHRRWAALLRRIFEVDPLRCPRCGEAMRIVAFITAPPVIDRILAHRRCQAHPAPPPARAAPLRPSKRALDGSISQPYFGRAD